MPRKSGITNYTPTFMAQDSVDLGALQQQLQQRRSALADQILSHLPKGGSSAPVSAPSAPRPARLGVGAESKSVPQLSAADQRLRAQLADKNKPGKRTPEQEGNDDEDEDEEIKGSSVSKKGRRATDPFAAATSKAPPPPPPQDTALSKAQRKKMNKRRRLEEEQSKAYDTQETSSATEKPNAARAPNSPEATVASSARGEESALTSLQSSMLTSLKGARFRSINEKLYTSSSSDALALMQDEPQVFAEYHDGFRQQVRKWPQNPVDVIASLLKGKGKKSRNVRATAPGTLIVDLGAGEAGLARQLVPIGYHVLSYDLVNTSDGWVRGVDAARLNALPLPGLHEPLGVRRSDAPEPAVANVAVFCLSLMGTNWLEMIIEARRVLRYGGELIVAEVTSRFGPDGAYKFCELVRAVGFELDWEDTTSNTHFALFKFTKHAQVSAAGALDHNSQEMRLVHEGGAVLRPCLYKRR